MSKFGDIINSFGHNLNFVITNTSGENVLNNTVIANSFIIAAQQKETCGGIGIPTHEDNGIYSILCSDNNGESVRFTYTLSEGNGIICDNDIVYFDYDNNFTINNSEQLSLNIKNFIDNQSLKLSNNKITADVNNIGIASEDYAGIVNIDDITIKMLNNSNIYVNTDCLTNANHNSYGIMRSDNNTLNINNGVLSVDTNKLQKCSDSYYGIAKCDNKTIKLHNNKLTVNINELKKASETTYGLIKLDGKTLLSNNGVIYVNVNNLSKGTNDNHGVIKLDNTFTTDCGCIGMKNYNELKKSLETQLAKTKEIDEIIRNLDITNKIL